MRAILETIRDLRADIRELEDTKFKAKLRQDGSVVISDQSLWNGLGDIVSPNPAKLEKVLRTNENVYADMSDILDMSAGGALLSTIAAVGCGVINRSPGSVYKGLVIGGYVMAELKLLSWAASTTSSLSRKQRDALEKVA